MRARRGGSGERYGEGMMRAWNAARQLQGMEEQGLLRA